MRRASYFDFLFSFFECISLCLCGFYTVPVPQIAYRCWKGQSVISPSLLKVQHIAELIWLLNILCCCLWICLVWRAFCGRELICLALVGPAGEPLLKVSTSYIWACVLTLPYFRLAAGVRLSCCTKAPLHLPWRQNSDRYTSLAPIWSSVVFTCVFWPVPGKLSAACSLSGLIADSCWEGITECRGRRWVDSEAGTCRKEEGAEAVFLCFS